MKLKLENGCRIVRSRRGITLYCRQMNQTAIYIVAWFGIVIHMGSRRHCARMFKYYVPDWNSAIEGTSKSYEA